MELEYLNAALRKSAPCDWERASHMHVPNLMMQILALVSAGYYVADNSCFFEEMVRVLKTCTDDLVVEAEVVRLPRNGLQTPAQQRVRRARRLRNRSAAKRTVRCGGLRFRRRFSPAIGIPTSRKE